MAKIALQQVAIVGPGLLGTSLGLALKRLTPAPRIVGCDLSGDARREAIGKRPSSAPPATSSTPWTARTW